MSDIIEPIAFLKDHLSNPRAQIILQDKELVFKISEDSTPLKIPADVPTAWSKNQRQGYYSLGQLWIAVVNKALKQQDFKNACQQMAIPLVQIMDRDAIVEYFCGKKAFAEAIDETVRVETQIKRSSIKAGRVNVVTGQDLVRRRDIKAEEKKEQREKRVCDILVENEKKIAGKTTCLQSQGRSFLQVLQLAYKLTGHEDKSKEIQDRIEKRMIAN